MGTPIWQIEGVALDSTGEMVAGSLGDYLNDIWKALYSETVVYPNLTDGATVISANADWTLGAYATVVPASTITADYHVTALNIESCDKNAVFQVELYEGAADNLIATVRFAQAGGFFGNAVYRVAGELVPANARLRARLASSDGLANQATITISVRYHLHS